MKNEKLTEYELKLCKEVKNALVHGKKNKILVYVVDVAKSGMSRRLRFTFIDKHGNVCYLDYLLSKFCGTLTDEGLRVRGCGMDMIFHTLECFLSACGVKNPYHYAGNYTRI